MMRSLQKGNGNTKLIFTRTLNNCISFTLEINTYFKFNKSKDASNVSRRYIEMDERQEKNG